MCVDELLFYDKVLSKKWGGRPFEKKVTQNENFKKKNIKQPTTVADKYSHKSSSSSSVDVHGYTKTLT